MSVPSGPIRIEATASWPLFDVQATRMIEKAALANSAESLMQKAGLATARLALALAPHAGSIWIAAGPGHNGADGLEAALHLQAWGKQVTLTWLGAEVSSSPDTRMALHRTRQAGVTFSPEPPARFDFCVDALLGIGATRAPEGTMAQWIRHMRASRSPVLSIDVPTGLNADTGVAAESCVQALATLCMLTLKPGLFTASGRDATDQVWLDTLGQDMYGVSHGCLAVPTAALAGTPAVRPFPHDSHKGSFGDVAIVGGAPGMTGAALLAGTAAMHCGAGRVYLALLDPSALAVDAGQPELMLRAVEQLDLSTTTIVCGCGGGDAVRAPLPRILSEARRLVLDADALNAIARDPQLQVEVRGRLGRNQHTVLTPHPLEAARLLNIGASAVQHDRLAAAERLALDFQCAVVLKGSGTVVAAPDRTPSINPTGNARLATAGTGDVLAGAIGAGLAAGIPEFQAACEAVFVHGRCADEWAAERPFSASLLARALHSQNVAARRT